MHIVTRSRPRPARALALAAALLVGACASAPSPSPASAPPTAAASVGVPPTTAASTSSPSTPASSAPSTQPSSSGTASASFPVGPDRPDLGSVRVTTEVAVDGLESPLWVGAFPDGSGRLAVAEQGGKILIVKDGTVAAKPYLDISKLVLAGGERGLLGVAFPPGFGSQHQTLYVHYSDHDGNTTIASVDAPAGASSLDPSTLRILYTAEQPYPNHNGGWIAFDPTGMLLIALGDGGGGGDPGNRASSLDGPLGKILRIDVLGAPAGQPYGIPPDNPFVGRAGALPEILHYGLRNPFRDSIDPATGNLWIGDVGQDRWEEVDVAPAGSRGLDLGWRRWEGHHCYQPPTGCDPTGVTMPTTEYPHTLGCAVIGGVVYHGDAIPALKGAYLFSDNCSGTVWAIDTGLDAPQAPITLTETKRPISSIGVDASGEVVLTDLGGALLRLVPST